MLLGEELLRRLVEVRVDKGPAAVRGDHGDLGTQGWLDLPGEPDVVVFQALYDALLPAWWVQQ